MKRILFVIALSVFVLASWQEAVCITCSSCEEKAFDYGVLVFEQCIDIEGDIYSCMDAEDCANEWYGRTYCSSCAWYREHKKYLVDMEINCGTSSAP